MIAITKVLFDVSTEEALRRTVADPANRFRRVDNVGDHELSPAQKLRLEANALQVKKDIAIAKFNSPEEVAKRAANVPVNPNPVPYGKEVAAAQEARVVPAAAAQVTNVAKKVVKPAATNVSQATADHRATFNSLPNRGRDLRIAGIGQKRPINAADQATYDAAHKQIVTKRLAGGVPGVVAKTDIQPHAAVAKVANQDMSGTEHLMAAAKKGVGAVGDAATSVGNAVTTGAKHIADLAGEHPALAGIAAGATGALGLRKIFSKNKQI